MSVTPKADIANRTEEFLPLFGPAQTSRINRAGGGWETGSAWLIRTPIPEKADGEPASRLDGMVALGNLNHQI
jgi:hypothetical protein